MSTPENLFLEQAIPQWAGSVSTERPCCCVAAAMRHATVRSRCLPRGQPLREMTRREREIEREGEGRVRKKIRKREGLREAAGGPDDPWALDSANELAVLLIMQIPATWHVPATFSGADNAPTISTNNFQRRVTPPASANNFLFWNLLNKNI